MVIIVYHGGSEDLNNDQYVGQLKSVITDDSIETVRCFITQQPKSAFKLMEMKLGMSKTCL